MDMTQQQYIIALAETDSMTMAARKLGISQPALSNWLKNIESQLGTPLVIRSSKSISLTPAGKIYLEGARKMLAIRNRVYQDIQALNGQRNEVIRLVGTPNGGAELFARLFQDLKQTHPEIELQFLEGYNRQAIQMVREGQADIAFCSSPTPDIEGVSYIQPHTSRLVLMMPASYPMAYDASSRKRTDPFPTISLKDLEGYPFIMPNADMSYYDSLMQRFRELGLHPRIIFQNANAKVIYDMVRGGNGIGVLSSRYFSPLDPVSPFNLDPPLVSYGLTIYRKDAPLTPGLQLVLDYMKQSRRS